MISAERFAQIAGSYWKTQFPRLEHFVRVSNMAVQSFAPPITLRSDHDRHAVISEAAFVMWKSEREGQPLGPQAAFTEASARLAVVWDQVDYSPRLQGDETDDVTALLQNIQALERTRHLTDLLIEPQLPGCGVVSGGRPDFRGVVTVKGEIKTVIGELKTVQRNFRSVDYRQVIAYVVLNYAATHEVLDYLWLANPMRGNLVVVDVDSFFWLTRSQSSDEACAEIAYEWADPGVSP